LRDRAAAEKVKVLGGRSAYQVVGYAEHKGGAYRFIAA
jgi:hypothetical protein